jgi:Predicted integral membrane protein
MRTISAKKVQAEDGHGARGGARRRLWLAQLFDLPSPLDSKLFNRTDALLLGLIGLVVLASSLPFFYAAQGQMPEAGDLIIHWPRMLAFDETLRSGVEVPRWLGGMNGGYGAATTLFYAPLLYYALSAAHALTGDWPKALEAVIGLAALGSGVALYACARTLCSRGASAVAALLYVLSPYHLIDLYHRGALAELLAFVWMPLVMRAFVRVTERFRAPAVAGGAMAFALLILAHPPTAYLFTLAFVVFVIFYATQAKRWQPLVNGLVMLALGGAVAAFYALPAVIEKPLVNQSVTDLFHQRMGFITELLAGNRFEQLIGAIAVTMALLWVAFSWLARGQAPDTDGATARRRHFAAWKLVGALSLVMLLPLARPLVGALPGMAAVAFVWRWLAIAMLAMAMLAGAATDGLLADIRRSRLIVRTDSGRHKIRPVVWALVVALLMVGSVAFGIVAARASNLRIAFVAPAENFEQDFTPSGTPSVYELPRGKTCEFIMASPDDEARLIEWQPEHRVIETTSPTGGVLHLYSLMYPGWTATLDGLPLVIETHPQLKTMLINVPPGHQRLILAFNDTPTRRVAGRISLAALGMIAVMLLASRLRHQIKRGGRAARDLTGSICA